MDDNDQTRKNYGEWRRAYDHFNAGLFNNLLPGCVITFQRHRHAYGFFAGSQFEASGTRITTDEIAINPHYLSKNNIRDALSTLVHEMVHQRQWCFGKPGAGGYHNKEWARLMIEIGLVPSDTGERGGKATGRRIGHIIREDGPFDRLSKELLSTGFVIPYVETDFTAQTDGATESVLSDARTSALLRKQKADEVRKRKAASKTLYTCPGCEFPKHVWGKPGLNIICGDCDGRFEATAAEERWPSWCEPKDALVADHQDPAGEEW